jgi:hypothetical protein
LETPFKPQPYEVVGVKGTMLTASNPTHKIERNVSFFKNIYEITAERWSRRWKKWTKRTTNLMLKKWRNKSMERMATNDTPAPDQSFIIIRRSQRDKKRPEYLKDYGKMISAD